MDPNEALSQIRDTYRGMQSTPYDTLAHKSLSIELVELVEALDEWLSKGGFLPWDWAKAQRPAKVELR